MAYVSHQIRSGTKAVWEFNNPVLDLKEMAFEVLDTGIGTGNINIKQGDGVHTWNELPYAFYYPDSLTDEKVKTVKRAVNDDKNIYIAGTYDTVDHVGIEYIDDSIFIGSTKGELNSLSLKTKQITVNPNEDGIIISTVKSLKKGITINAEFSTGIFIDNKATNIANDGLDSAGYGLFIDNNSVGGIGIHNHGNGSGISIGNYTTGFGEYINNISTGRGLVIDNRSTGHGISINNLVTGRGIQISNAGTYGIVIDNTNNGYGQYILNSAGGQALHIANTSTGYGIVIDNTGNGFAEAIHNNSNGYGVVIYNNGTGTSLYIDNTHGGSGIYVYGNSTTKYNIYSEGLNWIKNITTQTINSYIPTDIIGYNVTHNLVTYNATWNTRDSYQVPSTEAVILYCNNWEAGKRITLQDDSGLNFKDGSNLIEANALGMHIGSDFGEMHLQSPTSFFFHTAHWTNKDLDPYLNINLNDWEVISNLNFRATSFTPTSLVELKRNIISINNIGLDLVNNTDVYSYEFKTQKEDDNYRSFGFVIGEGYKLSSELLASGKDGINLYSSVAIAYKAIQELTKENNDLKSRCNDLHYRLEKIEQLLLK